jgi:hypothetical protein
MYSWGDAVGEAAQADLDRLLNAAIRFAQARLTEALLFQPAALLISDDGRVLEVDQDRSALGKHPDVQDLVRNAVLHLRQVRDQSRCTALVLTTRLPEERTDAVEIRLEHRDGTSAAVLLPYKRPTFGGHTEYGDLRAFVARPLVWT